MSDARREAIERAVREACAAGDWNTATSHAIRGYGPELLTFLIARRRDRAAASEAFSLLCEDLWRGLPGFEWRSTLRVWAYTLARHAADRQALSQARAEAGRLSLGDGAVAELAVKVRTETLAFLRTPARDRVRALRERLSPDDASLLVLRVDKGMSWVDIACVMSAETTCASDELSTEAARLRKRFQLIKARLRRMAVADGLLEEPKS